MHKVSANYTLPTVLNTLKPVATSGLRKAVNAKASTGTTTGTTSGSSTADGIGSTFLNLLSTELQNQDPTAPVDSTAMVGQMISLNQLDQLISINQTLTGSSTATTGAVQPGATAGDAARSSANGGVSSVLPPSVAGAVANQLPFDPNTMMPLNPGNPGAAPAYINPSGSPATIGSSPTRNNTSGGK
ncbi:MAG TPA: flagellar hook capping FlgD N-terminal domain-containing protein [Acidobacteriaceae bacterium]|nr:flagellar hook capping FlgD N-terminal domain-containing protein [Acidobacteriaceae bacterium]